jgi:hypothetical protein
MNGEGVVSFNSKKLDKINAIIIPESGVGKVNFFVNGLGMGFLSIDVRKFIKVLSVLQFLTRLLLIFLYLHLTKSKTKKSFIWLKNRKTFNIPLKEHLFLINYLTFLYMALTFFMFLFYFLPNTFYMNSCY